MYRFVPIRRHRRRANRGQVSAVATILGLLLVVSFIAEFEIAPLSSQLADKEVQHALQVENQLSRLQATILAEAESPNVHVSLSSAVTLGSEGVPPWGAPSPGQILSEPAPVGTVAGYEIARVVSHPPNWNTGSSCLTGGAGKCAGNGHVDTWNVTNANNSSFSITVNGNHNSVQYNISGNNDTITLNWKGGDTGFVLFVVNGSDDSVTYNKGGSDVTIPTASFVFYGERDVFSFNPSGSHSANGGMFVNVVFVGSVGSICPYGNLSDTDTLGTLSAGGSNLNMTVTWWNADGYVTAPHKVPYLSGGSNEFLTFQNRTGVIACAFEQEFATHYVSQDGSGLLVRLLNTYRPTDDVAYDQGAVVEGSNGGSSVMVNPPRLVVLQEPKGVVASLTLINLIGTSSTSAGYSTADVTATIVSVATFSAQNGLGSAALASPLFLNLTTAFPAAWASFFAAHPTVFPGGVTCTPLSVLSAPFGCLNPPFGVAVRLSAGLTAQGITLTVITASIAIL
ncbi:MAG: hypothetical protein L3J96_04140 [Thermoplasmata archaeon]|nr:hypothetical protein [Thermoplasmata archaeon]